MASSTSPPPVLVLGLGNVLLQDDGVGVRLLKELEPLAGRWEGRAELVEGGTLGMALLDRLSGRAALLILDAVATGAPPGSAREFTPEEVGRALPEGGLSPHEKSALELLRAAALLGELPRSVVILGVEPASMETGFSLTPEVEAALPAAVALAAAVIDRISAPSRTPGT